MNCVHLDIPSPRNEIIVTKRDKRKICTKFSKAVILLDNFSNFTSFITLRPDGQHEILCSDGYLELYFLITSWRYRTIILPVVLYGYETWSLTLREERILRVFKNRLLRRVFGPKRDEVTMGMEKIT